MGANGSRFIIVLAVFFLVLSMVLGSQLGSASSPPPWLMFHHDPQHTGRSAYEGPRSSSLKWYYAVGEMVRSSPAVGPDGRIYVSGPYCGGG